MAKEATAEVETEAEVPATPSMEDTAAAAYESSLAKGDDAAEVVEEAAEEPADLTPAEGRKRGAGGKFLAAEAETPEAPAKTETPPKQPDKASDATSEATAIAAPASMSAAEKTVFAKLPAEAKAFVLRRESDVNRVFQQKTQELAERGRAYDQLDQVLKPRQQQFAMMGITAATAIDQLLALSDFATKDLPGFFKYMAEARGFDLRTLHTAPDGQPLPQQQTDPAIAALQREIRELKQTATTITTGQQQREAAQVNTEIATFRDAKGADGNVLHPHFDAVKFVMGKLMEAEQAPDLQSAYDMAVRANPTTFAQFQAEQQAAAERKRAADTAAKVAAARKAQGTVLAPRGTTPGKPRQKTMEETAREAYDKVAGAA